MNKHDEHLDDALKEALEEAPVPAPREQAKRAALAMARQEFESLHGSKQESQEISSQGIAGWLRHIVRVTTDDRRAIMQFNRKLMYSGVTAAIVGAVALGITTQYQSYKDVPVLHEDVGKRSRLDALEVTAADSRVAVVIPGQIAERKLEAQRVLASKSKPVDQYAMSESVAGLVAGNAIADAPAAASPATTARQATIQAGVFADGDVMPPPAYQDVGRDRFEEFQQNPVKLVAEEPVSTFSADVDTASYSFVRRMLNAGELPQADAVRAEELINYFDYDYPLPESTEQPFQPTVVISDAPWAEGRKLMHIGIKGYDIASTEKPRTNLVFLLDVSGSMNSPDKLPLVKQSMELLLTTLNPDDTVAIAVYAGAAGTVLEPTRVKDKQKILDAFRELSAGGSTAGAQGIRLAYELAQAQFDKNAINRVILATDGDFNVGITNQRELQSFIERKREDGIYLSVLGFGQGNYQDALMQALAQNGNGVAAYIDTLSEAQKVLVDESTSTLFPIARDVKLQVEFNPAMVAEYRLIGYETRHLNREDFNNDQVDAGDIGAGHTVTAIYEFTPVGSDARQIESSRYAPKMQAAGEGESESGEYAFLKIRYKLLDEQKSRLISRPITADDSVEPGAEGIGRETGFATAVAGFAQLLKGGKYTGDYTYDNVIELAQQTRGEDSYGYRTEFVQLVRKAKSAAAMRAP